MLSAEILLSINSPVRQVGGHFFRKPVTSVLWPFQQRVHYLASLYTFLRRMVTFVSMGETMTQWPMHKSFVHCRSFRTFSFQVISMYSFFTKTRSETKVETSLILINSKINTISFVKFSRCQFISQLTKTGQWIKSSLHMRFESNLNSS